MEAIHGNIRLLFRRDAQSMGLTGQMSSKLEASAVRSRETTG
jgi:hypothetical protein